MQGKNPKGLRPYPQRTLENALVAAKAIQEHNHGNPWTPADVSKAALEISFKNNKFYYVAAASSDYGLTVGTRDTKTIELSDVGKAIVFADDEHASRQNEIKAFLSVDIFQKVYDYYGGSRSKLLDFIIGPCRYTRSQMAMAGGLVYFPTFG